MDILKVSGYTECFSCTLCCFVAEVPSINKPPFQECINVTPVGCSLYGTSLMPPECMPFDCTDREVRDYMALMAEMYLLRR